MQRYANIMRIPICAIAGYGDSCVLNCKSLQAISSDISFAISRMSLALSQFDCKVSLCDQQYTHRSQYPFFTFDNNVELRTYNSFVVSNISIPSSVSCNDIVSFSFAIPEQLDASNDERIEYIELLRDGCNCKILFQPDWCELSYDSQNVYATARAWSFTDFDISKDECGEQSQMSVISVKVVTSKCSIPRACYKNQCVCGQSKNQVKCGNCEDVTCVECCFSSKINGIYRVKCEQQCNCRMNVSPSWYEIDYTIRGIWTIPENRDSVEDAIVGLSNYRATLDSCDMCDNAYKQRVRRDLGLNLDTGEPIQGAQYMYKNPLGIYTAGAKSAWQFISQYACEGGVFSA